MMRNIAIGLAVATVAIGGSMLSASAAGREFDWFGGISGLTSHEHQVLKEIDRERVGEFTPHERERYRSAIRDRLAELTPHEQAHLRETFRQRLADLTPLERKRLKGRMMSESYEQLGRLEHERNRHGAFGLR
jgi:hypothetical protein